MFFADAEAAAEALDIALTYRGEHQGQPMPMCGVPAHSHESYLARLIRRGFRVAICRADGDAGGGQAPQGARPSGARWCASSPPAPSTEETLLDAARPAWLLALAPARTGSAPPGSTSRPAPSRPRPWRPRTCPR